ncbi:MULTISPECIES: histidine phosphatase family protein [unclassified Paracoccus (in: a-proteobacteria)]|uniref:histidine phosphatase family protein n=1 Tax=unclassified Paracoccus (in: a-proteobacteria) TaxID=2688777 RepID=UPI0016037491|nr:MULTISPECIES: histidine phosphatase family protein [unclassified Paracoccus (in: a-proteobacteria)]MBB1492148.1 histidine phosphatase family protein [Paracoccus sp. MC1854]MBB1498567.1 histidine phosphatase family protein [Paracoccus sp. MC1862]QQO44178.1 histidine phosphatase family protein [Paracoccus sp. MC1862]
MVIRPGEFLFMRHGETGANAADVICGSTDLPLTPRGHEQARQAAVALAGCGIARIITSPLLRACQTAEAMAATTRAPVVVAEGLAERNWGEWEGRPRAILRRDQTPPGGESPAGFRDRIRAALAAIDPGQPVLIVAHSGTDREIHAALTTAPHRRMGNGEIRLWTPPQWICHEFFKPRA